jgi:pyrroline-5-carboxylate reductase
MRIGFIGSGSMAAAMARGWAGADGYDGELLFTDSGSGRAAAIAEEVGGRAAPDNSALASEADLVVLAVKPAHLGPVITGLTVPGKPILSVLGGTSLDALARALPTVPLARVMPNLAVENRQGVLCYDAGEEVDEKLDNRLKELLGLLGTVIEVDDSQIDAATAVMGCSPAYVALLAETLIAGAVREGIDPELARQMVVETVAGTGVLLREHSPEEVRDAVASPGGSTEAGLEKLEKKKFRKTLQRAIDASLEKMRG